LSGDLDSNDIDVSDPCDLPTEPTRAENSYHVVTAIRKDAVLDGFTITGGNSNVSDPWPHRNGSGGGIYIDTSSGKNPKVSNCTFRGNSSVHYGGGICYTSIGLGGPALTNCTFSKNWAGAGGGVYDGSYGSPIRTLILTNCRFIRNSAVKGGGMCIAYSRPTLTNCMFIGNSGEFGGASAHYDLAIATYSKCTFAANTALYGKAVYSSRWYMTSPSIIRLDNCIIRDGGEEIYNDSNSIITIIYSDVEGGWPGKENIDIDPCFVDVNNGDYHLKSQAGRWDVGSQSWVQDDVASLCIDAGNTNSPIGSEPFPNGGRINMGAYGSTIQASKSYFGSPVCETVVAGDINGDCIVNFKDLAFMAFHWLEDRGAANSNTIVDEGIEYYIHTDKSVYELGEHTDLLYRITNLTDEIWAVVGMGYVWDILVEVKEGENFRVVWSFGSEHSPAPGPGGLSLQPGESWELQVPWPQFNMNWTGDGWDYNQAPPGTYRVTGVLYGYRGWPEPPMEIHTSVSVDITVAY
jgi:predicted outer membrane repeat protein